MNTYYQVTATMNGVKEVLYGSFDKNDCKDEIDAEKSNWKLDGYKTIKIESTETVEAPCEEVYPDTLVTKDELFLQYAPCFNFELDKDQLLKEALERGFVKKVSGKEDYYMINNNY